MTVDDSNVRALVHVPVVRDAVVLQVRWASSWSVDKICSLVVSDSLK